MPEKDVSTFCPKNRKDWRDWLSQHHDKEESVWLIFYKKGSASPNLSWSEAVDEALCFGWIDSVKKTIDEEKYKQYFGKRKPKSNWSKINKEKVETLISSGLMTPAGLQSIEIAKQNGSWTILDAVEALIIPQDLEEALKAQGTTKDYFLGLSKSKRKMLLYWVVSAKRLETRQKRIGEIVSFAVQGLLPKQFR